MKKIGLLAFALILCLSLMIFLPASGEDLETDFPPVETTSTEVISTEENIPESFPPQPDNYDDY